MKRVAAVIGLASLILSACASESSTATANIEGALRVRRFSALPVCWFGERGTVYFVEDTELFYYCDGRNYVALDLQGLDGSDGVSWVVNVDEAPADLCPAGGALISAGPDVDGDGAADEVTSSQPVCDGIDGQDGMDGQDGTDGRDGAQGPSGDDGMNGQDGVDGGSCSVSTDQFGSVTIACDDGTVATIPPGGGSGGGTGGGSGGSGGTGAEPGPCPCYTEAELMAASTTGCRREVRRGGLLEAIRQTEIVEMTVPVTRANPGPSCLSPLVNCPPVVQDVGDFVARTYSTQFENPECNDVPSGQSCGPALLDFEERSCDGPGQDSRVVSNEEFSACAGIIQRAFVGGCSLCGDGNVDEGFEECDDRGPSALCNVECQFIECSVRADCNDGNSCTSDVCFVDQCRFNRIDDGEDCTINGAPGECFLGNCQPSIGGGGGPGAINP